MRGKGIAKAKPGQDGTEQTSSKMPCDRQCVHERKARLAHKHSVNQRIAERTANNEVNQTSNAGVPSNNSAKSNVQTKKPAQKPKDVEKLVSYIEGTGSANDKKKAKKERQKQEKMEILRRQQEEEKRLQAQIAREQQRIKEEEKRRQEAEQQMAQMSKKQIKKANQKAKKLAEEGLPSSTSMQQMPPSSMQQMLSPSMQQMLSPSMQQVPPPSLSSFGSEKAPSNPLSSLEDLKAQLNQLTTSTMDQLRTGLMKPSLSSNPVNNYSPSYASSDLNSAQSLDNLRGQHQRELEMLQLKHRQALEEEQMKLMHKQKEQQFMKQHQPQQYQPQQYQPMQSMMRNQQPIMQPNLQQSGKNGSKVKGNANVGSNIPKSGKLSNISSSAAEALAKADKNPGNQIRISRNAQGGVDFTTIPADQVNKATPPSKTSPANSMPPSQSSGSASDLSDMFNKNMTLQPKETSKGNNTTKSNKSKANESDQPMVTIRRVENPYSPEPTVTISQPSKKANGKNQEDKLLYTLVNGQVLKAKGAPDNLIPGAKPMPPSRLQQAR